MGFSCLCTLLLLLFFSVIHTYTCLIADDVIYVCYIGLPVYGIVENMSEILVPLGDKNLRFLDPTTGNDSTAEVMHKLEQVYPELLRYMVQFPMLSLCDNSSQSAVVSSEEAVVGKSTTLLSGPARMAQAFGTKHLGTIPMDSALLACGEHGQGLLESFPTSLVARHLSLIVDQIVELCTK